ncbi:CRISPR-associated helicase Cas3' [Actinokineospora sp. HUAS TT18]|uniref:CRISPR-associated helicase Cas3' n=1 Tax=Actinokineospora sp. HUAS TT18 TaxID=3447451 RepID=UPI003F52490C
MDLGVTFVGHELWRWVWAKSERDDAKRVTGWLPLFQHLDDTAGVAALLVDEWVSPQVISRLASELGGQVSDVRLLAAWLASVHDVGKVSPAFSIQVRSLANIMVSNGFVMSQQVEHSPARSKVGHALVGHLAVRDWLTDSLAFEFRGAATQLASVVASHHGVPPESGDVSFARGQVELVGKDEWARQRVALLERSMARVGGREAFARFAGVRLSVPALALLTAVVIVADWIASNPDFFPLWGEASLGNLPVPDEVVTARRLRDGWAAVALPKRWQSQVDDKSSVEVLFRSRFDREEAVVRDVQVAAVEAARAMQGAGLLVIEAPMGSGKTEAALLAAEVLAARTGADGCFVALPTQATTDAMFTRVHQWLRNLPGAGQDGIVSVSLAHGKARLNEEFEGLVRKGRFASVGDKGDDCGVMAHQWLSGRKKSALASFVVGTVDQVLFAGLKSRHLMLRHLALAGKVVVIDEVHAYDVYMSRYLCRVLQWLGAYGVPVVLLSATLPDARRAKLVDAYDSGAGTNTETASGYPVVTATGVAPTMLPLPKTSTDVVIDRLSDDLDTLVDYLRTHLREGGCAVVVRNTVTRVQETAARLSEEFGTEQVTINHARFLACDRSDRDRSLLEQFGPEGTRPGLHIVVASQVVEQSLDVDFDLMVTDLAPMDLMLQRMGRLHRHERVRPGPLRRARCAVTGVSDWSAAPVAAVRPSSFVYEKDTLLRAAALLVDRGEIRLPHEIAELVGRAYDGSEVGPADWRPAMASAAAEAAKTAIGRVERATTFLLDVANKPGSLVGWLRAGVGDADDDGHGAAQVRDGADSVEVIVVQSDGGGGLLVPSWVKGGGTQVPLDEMVPWSQAKVLAACTLRLPLALSHEGVIDQVIRELESRHRYDSFTQNPLLKGQLVLEFDTDLSTELHGYALTYDLHQGLIHRKITS